MPIGPIEPTENVEEARADAAAEIQDTGARSAERFDLPQEKLVNEVKGARTIANPFAPDPPVEDPFAPSLTAGEKRAGVLVVVTRDVPVRHGCSLAAPSGI
jgi:hypothetical protein